MYENQTYETIMQRLLAAVPDNLDKREGSFVWDALSPAALELAQLYIQMDLMLQYGFAQTTYGQYLDYRAGEHGLMRKVATRASGSVTITGSNGTVVAVGSLFATGAGVQFETLADVTIGEAGSIAADIRAVEAGARGNVPVGAITEIPVSIAGITAVTNANPTTGGTDQETDAALLERLLDKVRTPATSGNIAQYRAWAKEVPGVGDAYVDPRWAGPDTIRLFIIDGNRQPASTQLVADVQEYIDPLKGSGSGACPVDHFVTVVPAVTKQINITVTITKDSGHTLQQIQEAFEAVVTDYLKSIAFKDDSTVRYTRINNELYDTPGVVDYSVLTVNGGTGSISTSPGEVAVLGTVTLNE